jgi:parallel beta-helix repeat protein
MSSVTVKTYDKNGITCSDPGTSCSVSGSTVTGIGATSAIAQNGVQLGFGASGSITGTTITGNSYTGGGTDNQATGILIFDSGATTVGHDTLSANDINIFAGADSGAVAGNWSITGNAVSGATDNVTNGDPGNGEGNGYGDGIQIDGAGATNPTTVSSNTSSSNYEYGIALYSTASATVSGNIANSNDDGICVDSASGSNTITNNTTKHNTRYDLEDLSTGGGTAGTADTWTGNTCKPAADSTPEGLC